MSKDEIENSDRKTSKAETKQLNHKMSDEEVMV